MARARILLVDDDKDTLQTFKIWLELNDFDVYTYSNPLNALSEFRRDYFDLILLDIRMPEMTGFELYQEIVNIDPDIRICFITSFELYYTNLKEIYPILKNYRFLQKPVSMKKLLALVSQHLAG